MSKEWVVLHITDFHISDPSSTQEHLRENYFREYIDKLVKAIREQEFIGTKAVNAIVITGDFINHGNENGLASARFAHAKKVIDYLCNRLGVNIKSVFACNGNHDIDRDIEIAGKQAEARSEYEHFVQDFGNGIRKSGDLRSDLVKTGFGAHVLLTDSTIGAEGRDRPGIISEIEIDQVIDKVRRAELSEGEFLVVASHHPTFASVAADAPFEESSPDWTEKHVWQSAYPIYSRLKDSVQVPVLWLSGDIHRESHIIEGSIHTVVTGRLGTATGTMSSQVRRQARVVLVPQHGESRSWLCEFVPSGHYDQAQIGDWQVIERRAKVHGHSVKTISAFNPPIEETSLVTIQQQELVRTCDLTKPKCNQVDLLSVDLQAAIMGAIAKKKLYFLGRFATSSDESTMSWIPMSALLDQGELLSSLVTEIAKEVKKEVADTRSDRPIVIGIDSWGAILASQISVMTGIRNFCIAGRAEGITHSASERISKTVKDGVLGCDLIVLISDVIGTGRALKGVYDALSEGMSEKQKEQTKWSLLSAICDEKYDRERNLHFANVNMTACKDLRMPILNNDDLPPESILPAEISFVRH